MVTTGSDDPSKNENEVRASSPCWQIVRMVALMDYLPLEKQE